uniref:Non-specific lipid-transfer protein Auxin response factor n=1 Tax=Rhizophora mucronata TaxID=61149 RepID=A0A2P2J5Z9_RHIMU
MDRLTKFDRLEYISSHCTTSHVRIRRYNHTILLTLCYRVLQQWAGSSCTYNLQDYSLIELRGTTPCLL